jgi:3-hydroxyacyl-CoA dehydrogenase
MTNVIAVIGAGLIGQAIAYDRAVLGRALRHSG